MLFCVLISSCAKEAQIKTFTAKGSSTQSTTSSNYTWFGPTAVDGGVFSSNDDQNTTCLAINNGTRGCMQQPVLLYSGRWFLGFTQNILRTGSQILSSALFNLTSLSNNYFAGTFGSTPALGNGLSIVDTGRGIDPANLTASSRSISAAQLPNGEVVSIFYVETPNVVVNSFTTVRRVYASVYSPLTKTWSAAVLLSREVSSTAAYSTDYGSDFGLPQTSHRKALTCKPKVAAVDTSTAMVTWCESNDSLDDVSIGNNSSHIRWARYSSGSWQMHNNSMTAPSWNAFSTGGSALIGSTSLSFPSYMGDTRIRTSVISTGDRFLLSFSMGYFTYTANVKAVTGIPGVSEFKIDSTETASTGCLTTYNLINAILSAPASCLNRASGLFGVDCPSGTYSLSDFGISGRTSGTTCDQISFYYNQELDARLSDYGTFQENMTGAPRLHGLSRTSSNARISAGAVVNSNLAIVTTVVPDNGQVWIWGGSNNTVIANNERIGGSIFDFKTQRWHSIDTTGVASTTTASELNRRANAAVAWAVPGSIGSSPNSYGGLVVWGGSQNATYYSTGYILNTYTNQWTAMSTVGTPVPRDSACAVYSESMAGGVDPGIFIFGGKTGAGVATAVDSGGVYNLRTGVWTALPASGTARVNMTCTWTGSRVVVTGGENGAVLNTVSVYNPATNAWAAGACSIGSRTNHKAVWSGSDLLIWGGYDGAAYLNTGRRCTALGADTAAISTVNAPSARRYHGLTWDHTSSRMIVWGGETAAATYTATGAAYNVTGDSWVTISSTGALSARANPVLLASTYCQNQPGSLCGSSSVEPPVTKILVWGGHNAAALTDGALLTYTDATTGVWSTIQSRPEEMNINTSGSIFSPFTNAPWAPRTTNHDVATTNYYRTNGTAHLAAEVDLAGDNNGNATIVRTVPVPTFSTSGVRFDDLNEARMIVGHRYNRDELSLVRQVTQNNTVQPEFQKVSRIPYCETTTGTRLQCSARNPKVIESEKGDGVVFYFQHQQLPYTTSATVAGNPLRIFATPFNQIQGFSRSTFAADADVFCSTSSTQNDTAVCESSSYTSGKECLAISEPIAGTALQDSTSVALEHESTPIAAAMNAQGSGVVVYHKKSQSSSTSCSTYARTNVVFYNSSSGFTSPIQIDDETYGHTMHSAVSINADGNVAVVWEQKPASGSNRYVFLRTYNASTGIWSSLHQVNDTSSLLTPTDSMLPSVGYNNSGEIVGSFTYGNGGARRQYVKHYRAQ